MRWYYDPKWGVLDRIAQFSNIRELYSWYVSAVAFHDALAHGNEPTKTTQATPVKLAWWTYL